MNATKKYNFTFNFNTREEYKAQVAQWKAEYAELSQEMRATKNLIKELNSQFSKSTYATPEYRKLSGDLSSAQLNRYYLKLAANAMIADRINAKMEAQRQYLAGLNKEAA